ncbi:hypothetical protein ES703_57207 [subsurface metagenome]
MGITPGVKGLTESIIFVDGTGCRLHIRESLVGPDLYVLATNRTIDKKIELCALDVRMISFGGDEAWRGGGDSLWGDKNA